MLADEAGGEGVEREVTQEVATHPGVDLIEATAGLLDPLEGQSAGEAIEFGADVGVAEELRSARVEEQEIFKQKGEGA